MLNPTPLKKIRVKVSWDDELPNIMIIPKMWKNDTCSKPPTSHPFFFPGTSETPQSKTSCPSCARLVDQYDPILHPEYEISRPQGWHKTTTTKHVGWNIWVGLRIYWTYTPNIRCYYHFPTLMNMYTMCTICIHIYIYYIYNCVKIVTVYDLYWFTCTVCMRYIHKHMPLLGV